MLWKKRDDRIEVKGKLIEEREKKKGGVSGGVGQKGKMLGAALLVGGKKQ